MSDHTRAGNDSKARGGNWVSSKRKNTTARPDNSDKSHPRLRLIRLIVRSVQARPAQPLQASSLLSPSAWACRFFAFNLCRDYWSVSVLLFCSLDLFKQEKRDGSDTH
jgi:hypothetical protein